MGPAEFAELKDSIRRIGLKEAVWVWKGQLIDGAHRERACRELGVDLVEREWDGEGSLYEFVKAMNLHRRHLSPDQLAAVAGAAAKGMEEEARDRQRAQAERGKEGGRGRKKTLVPNSVQGFPEEDESEEPAPREPPSVKKAADLFGVGKTKVQESKTLLDKAPDLHEKVKLGDMSHAAAVREHEMRKAEAAGLPRESFRIEPTLSGSIAGLCAGVGKLVLGVRARHGEPLKVSLSDHNLKVEAQSLRSAIETLNRLLEELTNVKEGP